MSVIPVVSKTYKAGPQATLGPFALASSTSYSFDILPSAGLPAGVSLTYTLWISSNGGATWQARIGPNTSPGPMDAADLEIGDGDSFPPAGNYAAKLDWSLAGGSWTTGFTITVSS